MNSPRRREPFALRFPIFSLVLVSAATSFLLAGAAVLLFQSNFVKTEGQLTTLPDISSVFQGTIGSAIALAGSIVAIYLALVALRSVRRQEVADSQSYIDEYVRETYTLFVHLNSSLDDVVESAFDLFSHKETVALMDRIGRAQRSTSAQSAHPAMAQEASGTSPTNHEDSQLEAVVSAMSEPLVAKFLLQFSEGMARMASALESVCANHRASSIWRFCITASSHPVGASDALPVSQQLEMDGEMLYPLRAMSRSNADNIQVITIFFRRMARGMAELVDEIGKDQERRHATVGFVRMTIVNVLLGARFVVDEGASRMDAYVRLQLAVLGVLIYLGDMTYLTGIRESSDESERNVSLLLLQSVARAIPTKGGLERYFREHFFDTLVRDTFGESIFQSHMDSLQSIESSQPRVRSYFKALAGSDPLLRRPFLSFVAHGR